VRTSLLVVTTAAVIGFSMLSAPLQARDRGDRSEMTANQLVNQADARTARMKVDLRLTPDQEKNWAGFEGAMRDMGKKRADRQIARRDEQTPQNAPVDVLERINKIADAQIERSNDWKKLADAAKPFYASLDEQQKQRFADILLKDNSDRDAN
jgi:LTXXQ motif family protein